ncbi:MAG: glycosyltransferase family 2 protein [Thermoleophilaceae bacterium]|nr:glycosyltransferase family 2 protein [Thermoleophilaceae bacterium]
MTGRLIVAVCTNRRPPDVAECLAALEREAGVDTILLVTSGLPPEQAQGHRETFRVRVLEEPREGLSRARNRALAECADEDVLAFVDDDAVVQPGWWSALRRRWEEAPADVACIGGPIRPRFAVEPPAWLSPPLLPALTLLDLGPEPRDLDPFATTLYGANVSFRAGPLRAVGGFSPDFGHSGTRTFFSEEDEVERALHRRGHRIRYVPDAAVEHVIPAERLTAASFLRRRFWYGATLGVRRARPRRLALRQAASSWAGALVAAARGDERLLMERLVRVAENVGVLLGPLAAAWRRGA